MLFQLPFIEQRYDVFNTQMFNGSLPKVPIEMSRARTFLGLCVCKKKRSFLGKVKKYDFRLRFSTRFDLTEQELEDIIIHEMIHLYIGVNNIKDTSAHGKIFRQMMTEINSHFGRHITISHKLTPEQQDESYKTRRKQNIVAVVSFNDGRMGIKVLPNNPQRIKAYATALKRDPRIRSIEVYHTTDTFFNRFPCSSALRVHILPKEEITSHL